MQIISFFNENDLICFPGELEEEFKSYGIVSCALLNEYLSVISQDDLSTENTFIEKLELIKEGKDFSHIDNKKYTLEQKLEMIREISNEDSMFASSLSKPADANLIKSFLKDIEHTHPDVYQEFKNSEMNCIYKII